jgi:hypothetical protein
MESVEAGTDLLSTVLSFFDQLQEVCIYPVPHAKGR